MNITEQEKLESAIIDYIDGRLADEERSALEQRLTHDPEAKKLYDQLLQVMKAMDASPAPEPSAALRQSFNKMLTDELEEKRGRAVFLSPMIYRVAAAIALVACGVAIGVWINREQVQRDSLLALQQQMNEMKTLMMQRIDNQQSASQRMLGVSVALELEKPDDEIIDVLVKTLNEDGNTNVRLAALDALGKFSHEDKVRKALIRALRIQKDPVVQIALIQLMVKMKESSIKNELKKIVDDKEVIQAVKDEAYSGLLKLS